MGTELKDLINNIRDGENVKAGKEFDLGVDDIADILDDDFDALQKVLDVFSEQFAAKMAQTEGNEKGGKKTPKKK